MDNQIIYCIKNLDNAIFRKMFKKMKESHGMPFNPMQGEIAKILFKNKDKDIYQRDLEKIIGIRRSTISGILKTMEKNGLIMRIDSVDNRKVKKIILTEKALNIHSSIADKVKEMNNEIIKGISEEELIVFFNVADKIKKNLED
jgi:DNA-binding MarR family transcriptional regulator